MKSDNLSIEERLSQLPVKERARLALELIESLEPGADESVDELWLDEAERRLEAYDQGSLQARDMDDAMSEIERRLK